ncbi:class I SAM-dependent methyltransferase [bacterium]|nr:class I SAM-dependent methyltransferase [bacterium]
MLSRSSKTGIIYDMAHDTSSDFGADPAFWHRRFLAQAEWTRELRYHLYRTLEVARRGMILDLGCGTGVIAAELAGRTMAEVHAADREEPLIAFARREHRDLAVHWQAADAAALPFRGGSFDLVVTQWFWMWAADPGPALAECRRVLAPGGMLAALGEPDYGGRRDETGSYTKLKVPAKRGGGRVGGGGTVKKRKSETETRK